MGAFRLLLAMAVVSIHSGPVFGLQVLHGNAVVQAFFIVSGFYMGLVLDTKYADDTASFYANRLLRLGPTYLVAVTLAFATALLTGRLFYATSRDFAEFWHTGDFRLILVVLFTNVFVVGQEWAVFLPTRDVHPAHPGVLHFYQLIPQGWSIALELYFYALAPFLARLSTRALWGCVVASGALRVLLWAVGLDDRWQYFFFPTSIIFFVAGLLSYRAYRRRSGPWQNTRVCWFLTSLMFLAVLGASVWTPAAARLLESLRIDIAPESLFLVVLPFLIPSAFAVTRHLRSDKFLGDLCYPIYLTHITVILWARAFRAPGSLSPGDLWAIDGLVIVVALIIYAICDRPMDRFRKLRFSRPVRSPETAPRLSRLSQSG